MLFSDPARVRPYFEGRRVAIVGSGPGCTDNEPGLVDGHDVVVRVNNYKVGPEQGFRCDVFYSFFGGSITKPAAALQADGVTLCLAKCPDAKFMESDWHRRNNKPHGVDFRYIYRDRAGWWFCPTYVPTVEEFRETFHMLGGHIPSTGFSAVLEVLRHDPAEVYLTGFDFFASRVHNVNEPWRPGNPEDPIGHAPERERDYVRSLGATIQCDKRLRAIMEG